MRTRLLLPVLAVLSTVVAGCSTTAHGASNPGAADIRTVAGSDGFHGTVLDQPYSRPAVPLVDTHGRPYRLDRNMTHPVSLVFFGYTHCQDVCPAVLADVAAALHRLDPTTRRQTQLVFITVDPKRDDPATLRAYLNRFDPSFVGLTGPMSSIQQAAADLGVALTGATPTRDGGYDVGHSSQVIGFGPDGTGDVIWMPGTPVGDLRADVERLASEA